MSLQVWLPLNKEGNFLNQGLADVIVTNNGATYNNNGKIGGTYECYSGYLKTNIKCSDLFQNGDSFSYSLWIKIIEIPNGTTTDQKRGGCFGCNLYNGGGFGILLYNDGTVNAYICNNTNANLTTFIIPNLNEWNHYTFTYNKINKQASIYVNGNLIKNYTISFVWGTNNSQFWIGKNTLGGWQTDTHLCINDVRIYDHCLSPKEVREIAKGLVLHYPLNDEYVESIVYDCSGYCNNGTVTGSLQVVDDSPRYKKSTKMNKGLISCLNPISNNIHTVSFWMKTLDWTSSNNNYNVISAGNGWFIYRNHNSPCRYTLGNPSKSSARYSSIPITNKTEWNHICTVSTGSLSKIYVNGTLMSADSVSLKNWGVNLFIIGPGYDDCILSDVRLYSTALSDDDVKELYNTSAIINNNNTLEAYEFSEADTYSINKSGVLEGAEFIEQDGSVLINNTEQVFATEFIEI